MLGISYRWAGAGEFGGSRWLVCRGVSYGKADFYLWSICDHAVAMIDVANLSMMFTEALPTERFAVSRPGRTRPARLSQLSRHDYLMLASDISAGTAARRRRGANTTRAEFEPGVECEQTAHHGGRSAG